ncbi:putative RNA-binding protein [Nakaseomyces bracarensis]|uniref:RNA-binding protein n=1 Tax=Nakaseomyces bracarensis TaxID=273131 RepID=A0ABR4NRA5_9SACH
MSNHSQLELLANTNQLTVRLKPCSDDLLSEIHSCIHKCKGTLVPQKSIEPYERMNESSRKTYLKDIEYATIVDKLLACSKNSLGPEDDYDTVIQCNFKNVFNLKNCSKDIQDIITKEEEKDTIEFWSISMNNNTLSHPGNLFIGGIPKNTSLIQLINKFKEYGSIVTLKLIFDNKNVGYGFLSYLLGSQAAKCIKDLNGTTLTNKDNDKSTLFINYHIERKERERLLLTHDQHSPSNSTISGNTFIYNDHRRRASTASHSSKKCNYYLSNDELDDEFDCVFIGNLPITNFDEDEFVEFLTEIITEKIPDITINSYYFPFNTVLNQYKGYGFVKVDNNDKAKILIHEINVSEFKFKDMRLIANKASQSNSNVTQPYFNSYNNGNNGTFTKSAPKMYSSPPSSYGSSIHNVPNLKNYTYRYPVPNNNQAPVKPLPYLFGLPLPLSNQQESNIYVKHIPLDWSDNNLFDFYRPFGNIISCKIITVGGSSKEEEYSNDEQDLPYGISRGYGFVYFENPLDAANAVMATDGYFFEFTNQRLSVSYAQKKNKSKHEENSSKKLDTGHSGGSINGNLFQNKFYRKYNKKFLAALLASPYYESFASKGAYRMTPPVPPAGVPSAGHPHPGIMPFPVIPTGPISIVPPAGPPGASWYTYPLYSQYNMDGGMDNLM